VSYHRILHSDPSPDCVHIRNHTAHFSSAPVFSYV
jgi:hypothetical protein